MLDTVERTYTMIRLLLQRFVLFGLFALVCSFTPVMAETKSVLACPPSNGAVDSGILRKGESFPKSLVTAVSASELLLHTNVRPKITNNSQGGLKVEFSDAGSAGGTVLFLCGCGASCGGDCNVAVLPDTAFCQGGCYKQDGTPCTSCTWRKLETIVTP